MKQILNTLNISDFISKCTNYNNYNTYIYYRTLHGGFFVTEHSRKLLLTELSVQGELFVAELSTR